MWENEKKNGKNEEWEMETTKKPGPHRWKIRPEKRCTEIHQFGFTQK